MAEYKSLEILYFNRQNVLEEYNLRLNSCCTYHTELKICSIQRGEGGLKRRVCLFYSIYQ